MARQLEDQVLSVLCRQLAMLLESGVDGAEALELLSEQTPYSAERAVLLDLSARMEQGQSFAVAVADNGKFGKYATDLIRLGETSGRLQESLYALADYYQQQERITSHIRSALLYPSVLLLLMCAVLAVLVFAVVPIFTGVYETLSGTLIGSSYGYVAAAEILSRVALLLTAVCCVISIVCLLALGHYRRSDAVRHMLETFPLTKPLVYQLAVGHLTQILSTLIASGMDMDTTLDSAINMVSHRQLRQKLQACTQDLQQGISLVRSLYQRKVYAPLRGRLLLIGAGSGNLPQTLTTISQQISDEGQEKLYHIVDTIEPVLTVFLTLCVGLSLLSTMLPLIGMLGAIG